MFRRDVPKTLAEARLRHVLNSFALKASACPRSEHRERDGDRSEDLILVQPSKGHSF